MICPLVANSPSSSTRSVFLYPTDNNSFISIFLSKGLFTSNDSTEKRDSLGGHKSINACIEVTILRELLFFN